MLESELINNGKYTYHGRSPEGTRTVRPIGAERNYTGSSCANGPRPLGGLFSPACRCLRSFNRADAVPNGPDQSVVPLNCLTPMLGVLKMDPRETFGCLDMKFTIRDLFWTVLVAALVVYSLSTSVRNRRLRAELVMVKGNLEVATNERERSEYKLNRYAVLKARLDAVAERDHLLEALSSNLSEVVRLLDLDNTPQPLKDYKYRLTRGRDALDEVLRDQENELPATSLSQPAAQ